MARGNTKKGGRKAAPALKEEAADKVVFYHDWCKHCNICVSFCPKQALAMDADDYPQLVAPEQCNSCGLCEVLCPDLAVTVPGRIRHSRPQARNRKRDGGEAQ
jgi:2-oxoglutarate ferredoxin oxidoreductase subunit delta